MVRGWARLGLRGLQRLIIRGRSNVQFPDRRLTGEEALNGWNSVRRVGWAREARTKAYLHAVAVCHWPFGNPRR